MKHIWVVELGEFGSRGITTIAGFTKTKKEAQAWCRSQGHEGSDETFTKGVNYFDLVQAELLEVE